MRQTIQSKNKILSIFLSFFISDELIYIIFLVSAYFFIPDFKTLAIVYFFTFLLFFSRNYLFQLLDGARMMVIFESLSKAEKERVLKGDEGGEK
jgi:hypothetical protein